MYAWLWRHLPFGLRGKIASAAVLVIGVAALLWYVVFPAVEPALPFFYDVQVGDENGGPASQAPPGSPATGNPSGTASRRATITITPSQSR